MSHVYEVTLEVETKLFRQEVRFMTDNAAVVAVCRHPGWQRGHGCRFVSVRGPIAVLNNSSDVMAILDRERDEAERIATGADKTEG